MCHYKAFPVFYQYFIKNDFYCLTCSHFQARLIITIDAKEIFQFGIDENARGGRLD